MPTKRTSALPAASTSPTVSRRRSAAGVLSQGCASNQVRSCTAWSSLSVSAISWSRLMPSSRYSASSFGDSADSFNRRCTVSTDTPKRAATSSTPLPSSISALKASNSSAGCMASRPLFSARLTSSARSGGTSSHSTSCSFGKRPRCCNSSIARRRRSPAATANFSLRDLPRPTSCSVTTRLCSRPCESISAASSSTCPTE